MGGLLPKLHQAAVYCRLLANCSWKYRHPLLLLLVVVVGLLLLLLLLHEKPADLPLFLLLLCPEQVVPCLLLTLQLLWLRLLLLRLQLLLLLLQQLRKWGILLCSS